jgi:hypothetical protein
MYMHVCVCVYAHVHMWYLHAVPYCYIISNFYLCLYFRTHQRNDLPKEEAFPRQGYFSMQQVPEDLRPFSRLDPLDEEYARSKWCYDTPGVVHPDQVCSDSARI